MAGANRALIDADSVAQLTQINAIETTGANAERFQLLVKGTAEDTVDLQGAAGTTGWTQQTIPVLLSGVQYQVWNNDTNKVTVYIDKTVHVI